MGLNACLFARSRGRFNLKAIDDVDDVDDLDDVDDVDDELEDN